jgi:hypothetical protein
MADACAALFFEPRRNWSGFAFSFAVANLPSAAFRSGQQI